MAVLLCVVLLVLPSAVECGSGRAVPATDAQNVTVSFLPVLFDPLTAIAVDVLDYLYVLSGKQVIVYDPTLTEAYRLDLSDALSAPVDVRVSVQLELYVADAGKSIVQRFDGKGTLLATYQNSGPISDGKPLDPAGIALDMYGQLLVADRANSRLVLIDTVSGDVVSYVNGNGNTQLLQPSDVAVDAAGRIYVCDSGNNRTVAFAPNGTAVLGAWDADSQVQPAHITVDSANNVYVSDTANSRSLIYSPQGDVEWSQTWDSNTPDSVAVNSRGQLFIADIGTGQVIVVSQLVLPGTVLSVISGGFTSPKAVAVTLSTPSVVYLVDLSSGYVQLWSADGVRVGTFYQNLPITNPWGVAVSNLSGKVYATERLMEMAYVYDSSGQLLSTVNLPGFAQGVFVDDSTGLYYIATEGGEVLVYTQVNDTYKGVLLDAMVNNAAAVAVSPVTGALYVAAAGYAVAGDPVGGITVLNSTYSFQDYIGPLNQPYGIAIDACDTIYVSEAGANQLTVLDQHGATLRTIRHSFSFPTGVALDAHGRVYLADTNNDRVMVMEGVPCHPQQVHTAAADNVLAPARVARAAPTTAAE